MFSIGVIILSFVSWVTWGFLTALAVLRLERKTIGRILRESGNDARKEFLKNHPLRYYLVAFLLILFFPQFAIVASGMVANDLL